MASLNGNSAFDAQGNATYSNFKNDYHSEISIRRDKHPRSDKDTSNIEVGDSKYVGEKWNRYDCLSPILSKCKYDSLLIIFIYKVSSIQIYQHYSQISIMGNKEIYIASATVLIYTADCLRWLAI